MSDIRFDFSSDVGPGTTCSPADIRILNFKLSSKRPPFLPPPVRRLLSQGPRPLFDIENLRRTLPHVMLSARRFVVHKDGVPYQVNGWLASCNDPSKWATFEEVTAAYLRNEQYDGISYALGDLCGIDLDECLDDDGEILPWAGPIKPLLIAASAYIEVSRYGHGLHGFTYAKRPASSQTKKAGFGANKIGAVEIYGDNKFLTLTGRQWGPQVREIGNGQAAIDSICGQFLLVTSATKALGVAGESSLTDVDVIAKASASKKGERFRKLLAGDTSDYGGDVSRADMAFFSDLAFWCGNDAEQMERIARQSGLCREKWNTHRTYVAGTISKAISLCTDPYRPTRGRPKKSAELLSLVGDVELFHFGDKAYATISTGEHKETYPLKSEVFAEFLARRFYEDSGSPPGRHAMEEAISVMQGRAKFDGPSLPIAVRVGASKEAVYLDLCNADWQAVKITATGWEVVPGHSVPVRFLRRRGMQALPTPQHGGDWTELRRLLNAGENDTWILIVAWLVMALRASGPYPVLATNGEQGSGKSSNNKKLRRLIDPNEADLRPAPKNIQDLMIAAANSQIVAFDNLSTLTPEISDAICRLATGAGFGTRKLYSDDEESLLNLARPVLINGIGELATRQDLLERTIVLNLPTILPESRRANTYIDAEFERIWPKILGLILTANATALRNLPNVKLAELPRMADFAEIIVAAEPSLPWAHGEFLKAYSRNQDASSESSLDASSIGPPLRTLMERQDLWEGSALDLLAKINHPDSFLDTNAQRQLDWPKNPRMLSNALRRLAPALRSIGINVTFHRIKTARKIRMERIKIGE